MRVFLSIAVVAWAVLGRQLQGSGWFEAQDRHLVDSPHAILLESMLLAFPSFRANLASVDVRPDDLREFLPAPTTPARETTPHAMIPDPGSRPRNVILIVLESVGTRYLSLYGSKLDTTPRLVAERDGVCRTLSQ